MHPGTLVNQHVITACSLAELLIPPSSDGQIGCVSSPIVPYDHFYWLGYHCFFDFIGKVYICNSFGSTVKPICFLFTFVMSNPYLLIFVVTESHVSCSNHLEPPFYGPTQLICDHFHR